MINISVRKKYIHSLTIFLIILICYSGLAISFVVYDRSFWGDEKHNVETIEYFRNNPYIATLTNYPEVTTPFVYILYALWGSILSTELPVLRLLTIIIAIGTFLLLHRLLFIISEEGLFALLYSIFFMINPYVIGTSIFIYTDIPGLFFMLLAFFAVYHNKPLSFMISMASAILCRQYFIFFIIAIVFYYLCKLQVNDKDKRSIFMLVGCGVSVLPYIVLVITWGGFAPQAGLTRWTVEKSLSFHPSYLMTYTALITVYAFPYILMSIQDLFKHKRLIGISFGLSFLYFLFPVSPSAVTLAQTDFETVGLFHRFMKFITSHYVIEHGIFYVLFLIGLMVILYLIYDTYLRWQSRQFTITFLLNLSILSFLFVMPFSYHVWEKYLIPALPFIAIRLLYTRIEKTRPTK